MKFPSVTTLTLTILTVSTASTNAIALPDLMGLCSTTIVNLLSQAPGVINALRVAANFPTCAQPCLTSGVSYDCSLTDVPCQCKNADVIYAQNKCFLDKCETPEERDAAYKTFQSTCKPYW